MNDRSPTPSAADLRAQRLAERLRANLRRRKAGTHNKPENAADGDLPKDEEAR